MNSFSQARRWSVFGALCFFPLALNGQGTSPAADQFRASKVAPSALAVAGLNTEEATEHLPGWFLFSRTSPAANKSISSSKGQTISNAQDVHSGMRQLLQSGDPQIEFVSPVFRDDKGGPILVTPRLLVGFETGLPNEQRNALRKSIDPAATEEPQVFLRPDEARWLLRSTDGFEVLKRANELARTSGVAYAEPDMMFTGYRDLSPSDPSFGQSWGLQNTGQSGGVVGFDMGAVTAWNTTTGDANIIVLVMDDGVQQNHPDLNLVSGRDFTPNAASNPSGGPVGTYDNLATTVAGCISAKIDNSIGAASRSTAMPCRFPLTTSPQWKDSRR